MPITRNQTFGNPVEGWEYIIRPGAYAVIRNAAGLYGVVAVPEGGLLVGGGMDPGESPLEALAREMREEIGWTARIFEEIGIATEYLIQAKNGVYLAKEGRFFGAELVAFECPPIETDHELIWLAPQDALNRLTRESHRWALGTVLNL